MKKIILLAIIVAATALAQQTVTISAPQSMNEPPVTATFSADAIAHASSMMLMVYASSVWPNSPSAIPQSTTLTSGMSATDTAPALTGAANLSVCNGLLVGGEAMLVTSVAPLTVQRGTLGTSPAEHSTGDPVSILRTGSYTCGLKSLWVDAVAQIISGRLNAVAQAAFAGQQAANAAVAGAGVQ